MRQTSSKSIFSFRAAAVAALAISAGLAHADATLDKIKQRGKVSIGVMVNGGPFGSIDREPRNC